MASVCKSLRASPAFGARSGRVAPMRVARSSVKAQAASRPLWFPGNDAPAHLDGSLPGDFGFDPLYLGQEPDRLKWYVHAELIHGRWAMLGAAGVLFTGIGAEAGLGYPQWYDAGKVALETSPMSWGTLLAVQFLLFNWAELARLADFQKPGCYADGAFLGFKDEFKGTENGYPGGKFFDPLGLARGTSEQFTKYKWNEIRNGRLAMVANVGFVAQYNATGKGPIQNLFDHVSDPTHVTFATNGVSIPQAPIFYSP